MTTKEGLIVSGVIVVLTVLCQLGIYSAKESCEEPKKISNNPTSTTDINNQTCPVSYELEYKNGELVKAVCERGKNAN